MTANIEKYVVPQQPGLDPVSVYFEDVSPGAGRVILVCYDMSWQGYWNSIGDWSIKGFFLSCNVDYLLCNFSGGRGYKHGKPDYAYLKKVIAAAHAYVSAQSEAA